jgi:hypothetical protein
MMASPAMVRIIDNKKVLMTPDEHALYQEICKAYDRPNFNGKDLFQDHFEVNDNGIILFVKPPHKKYSSLEVFTFLISLQVNQQLRIAQEQVFSLVKEAETKVKEAFSELDSLKKSMKSLREDVEGTKEQAIKDNSKEHETNDRKKE